MQVESFPAGITLDKLVTFVSLFDPSIGGCRVVGGVAGIKEVDRVILAKATLYLVELRNKLSLLFEVDLSRDDSRFFVGEAETVEELDYSRLAIGGMVLLLDIGDYLHSSFVGVSCQI